MADTTQTVDMNKIPTNETSVLNGSVTDNLSPLSPFKEDKSGDKTEKSGDKEKEKKKKKKNKKTSTSSKKSTKGRRTKAAQPKSSNSLEAESLLVGQVDSDVYVVEKICDKKVEEGVDKYWIKWKGWGVAHNTWEPIENLDGCSHMLKKFNESLLKKTTGRPAVENDKTNHAEVIDVIDEEDNDEAGPIDEKGNLKVLDVWPTSRIPMSVLTTTVVGREICYMIWCQPKLDDEVAENADDTPNIKDIALIKGSVFRKIFPHILITYYEGRISWQINESDGDELAKKAAMAINQKMNIEEMEKEKLEDKRRGFSGGIKRKLENGGENTDDDSDSSEDEIRIRSAKELFGDKDEYGLPATIESSEDEETKLCRMGDSESEEEDYSDITDQFRKDVNIAAEHVIV